jgi:hypothetical protein
MKNLLNCHCIGLHSFPISLDKNGFYRRIFYADHNHELWKPVEIAIHPHHVDIKITTLSGVLFNPVYKIDERGETFKKFIWNSHILNGNGGFEHLGEERLIQASNISYMEGQSVTMQACELHTVFVEKGKTCAWLIEETKPTCDYFPINYSFKDLTNWKPDGLYEETTDEVKLKYIDQLLKLI